MLNTSLQILLSSVCAYIIENNNRQSYVAKAFLIMLTKCIIAYSAIIVLFLFSEVFFGGEQSGTDQTQSTED